MDYIFCYADNKPVVGGQSTNYIDPQILETYLSVVSIRPKDEEEASVMEENKEFDVKRARNYKMSWTTARMDTLAHSEFIHLHSRQMYNKARYGQPLAPHFTTYLKLKSVLDNCIPELADDMKFLTLCEGPGSMAFYLLHRYKNSFGVGYTRRVEGENGVYWNWHQGLLEHKRFHILYPSSQDILEEEMQLKHLQGIDFVLADGGLSSQNQEEDATDLMHAESRIAVSVLRNGGIFILKIYNTLTKPMVQLLWDLSQCFVEIFITHSACQRASNQERYLVCNEKKSEYVPNTAITQNFINFIRMTNNRSLQMQTEALVRISQAQDSGYIVPLMSAVPQDEVC